MVVTNVALPVSSSYFTYLGWMNRSLSTMQMKAIRQISRLQSSSIYAFGTIMPDMIEWAGFKAGPNSTLRLARRGKESRFCLSLSLLR